MADAKPRSLLATNRLAAGIAVGSLLALVGAWYLYRTGMITALLPAHGPPADAIPLSLLLAAVLVALVVWSWNRLLSWFG